MAETGKLNIAELDFDTIKANLQTFLEAQSEFADYDFDASGLSTLLDLLAYNTHYMAWYTNMIANEMFLDTSVIRDSVVSHAKALAYTPSSYSASKVLLDITVVPQSPHVPDSILLPRGMAFKTTLDNKTYNYVITSNTSIDVDSSGNYIAYNTQVYEGAFLPFAYSVNTGDSGQRFIIPNLKVDTSTLKVSVRNSQEDDTTTVYTLSDDINVVTAASEVYWLQEIENGFFEVYFGDNVVGKKPKDGNLIMLEYVATNGKDANGAGNADSASNRLFSLASGSAEYSIGVSDYTTTDISLAVSTDGVAAGGSDPETMDSIKHLAPRYYESQNRAVTTRDYITIIEKEYTDIETAIAWGGEDNDPVDLGKVYISLKPHNGIVLSDTIKNDIKNTILKARNVVTIEPVIVDPDYTYVIISTKIYYDAETTNKSFLDIESEVTTTIKNYGDIQLEKFEKAFRFSRLSMLIDNTESSILNNETNISLEKRLQPTLSTPTDYTVNYNTELYHPADGHCEAVVSSTAFTYDYLSSDVTAYLEDDGSGVMRIYKLDIVGEVETKTIIDVDAGDVSYTTGKVTLNNFEPIAYVGSYIKITANTKNNDVFPAQNQIISIDSDDTAAITVSAQADEIIN